MRYFQYGGGYFPEKTTDKEKRQKDKRRYVRHCENVIEEDLGSRDYLITQLKLDVERGIETDYSKSPHIELIQADKTMIFESCDKWMETHTTDCLVTVNLVSLQIALLFTYASLGYKKITMDLWNVGDKQYIQTLFSNFTTSKESDYDWKNFEHLYNKYITNNLLISKFLTNGIITVVDYLSIDKIIEQYLNGWYTCQIMYTKIDADSLEMLPFEYIWHDLIHYYNFNFSLNEKKHSKRDKKIYTVEKMKKFYGFMNKFESKKKYSVKVIFFLSIHEAKCNYFKDEVFKGDLTNRKHPFYEGNLCIERFYSENDLLMLIPEEYRQNNKLSYLNTALANYLYVLEEFKKEEYKKEYNLLDDERLKRVEDMMTWGKNRPIKNLLLYSKEIEILGCELCTPSCCLSGGTRNKNRKNRKNITCKYPNAKK